MGVSRDIVQVHTLGVPVTITLRWSSDSSLPLSGGRLSPWETSATMMKKMKQKLSCRFVFRFSPWKLQGPKSLDDNYLVPSSTLSARCDYSCFLVLSCFNNNPVILLEYFYVYVCAGSGCYQWSYRVFVQWIGSSSTVIAVVRHSCSCVWFDENRRRDVKMYMHVLVENERLSKD